MPAQQAVPAPEEQPALGAPVQMAQAPMLGGAGIFGGYGSLMRPPETVASTDERQARLGQAFDKFTGSAFSGRDARAEREMQATNVFGNAIGGLMAMFGSDATAAGGAQLLQDVNQKVLQQKQERRLAQQDALTGLKTVTDVINNTSPTGQKALAYQLKAVQGGQKAETDAFKAQTSRMRAVNAGEISARKATETERHNKAIEDFKTQAQKQGLQLNYDKLTSAVKMQNAKNAIWQEIAKMQNATKQAGMDQNQNQFMQGLVAKYKMFNAKQLQDWQEFQAEYAQNNTQQAGGEAKFKNAPQLPDLLGQGLIGVDAEIEGLEDPISAAEQMFQQTAPVAPPQAPAQQAPAAPQQSQGPGAGAIPPQVGNNLKSIFQQMTQGANPQSKAREKELLGAKLAAKGYPPETIKQFLGGL
ncbi:MAG: hypothetical protein K2W95_00865 [Candidatus Obscuribacterales bacterium]|nr:hypothetical protein [Candidatus Obscuribacterales bacterium]